MLKYEAGSQVALGLSLCAEMDKKHREVGKQAWRNGDTSQLWSTAHWAGYQAEAQQAAIRMINFSAPPDWPTREEVTAIQADCPTHITYVDHGPADDRSDWVGA